MAETKNLSLSLSLEGPVRGPLGPAGGGGATESDAPNRPAPPPRSAVAGGPSAAAPPAALEVVRMFSCEAPWPRCWAPVATREGGGGLGRQRRRPLPQPPAILTAVQFCTDGACAPAIFGEQWLSLSRIAESFGHAAQCWSVRSRRSAVQRDVGLCACCGLARCCAPVGLLPGLYDGPAG